MSQLRANVCYVKDKIDVLKLTNHNYVTTENMLPNKCGIVECLTMPLTGKVTKFVKQDILVSNIRPYFKKIWYADRDGGCSADVLVFRIIDREKYDSKFLYYVLMQDKFFDHMVGGSNGTKMPRGNKNITMDFEINDYDLPIQRKIAGILSAYDDLIENNRRQIKLLEEAARRLYKEWFVDLRFPSHEQTEMVDGLPAGWHKDSLSNVAILKAGGDKPVNFSKIQDKNHSVPVFSNGVEMDGLYGFTDRATVLDASVTIAARGSIGFVCLHRASYVPIVRLISIIPHNLNLLYLFLYLKDNRFDGNGAAQQQITIPMIEKKQVVIPDNVTMKKFISVISPIFDEIEVNKKIINLLQEARDRLLPKLMNGEIEVE